MAVLRLGICVAGVYSMFLLWAVAQERLSVPFKSADGSEPQKFRSGLFLSTCQSAASALSALLYLLLRRSKGHSLLELLGLQRSRPQPSSDGKLVNGKPNGVNGHHPSSHHERTFPRINKHVLARYLQCSILITVASSFGFASLSHISYPTMVLAKSCKLVPVMLMNILLYRRNFALYKYVVVAMVSIGITIFMGFGEGQTGKQAAQSSLYGISLLLVNLAIDGATNSTQDEIFSQHRVNGQQMMLFINLFSTVLTLTMLIVPLPAIPVIHPYNAGHTEWTTAVRFIRNHPSIIVPLSQYALTGALGQLFIFETLQHFGSLTLVTVTLTRKMFTMLLSVFLYDHSLTLGQWMGAAVVFAGIGVEAWVKRKEVHAKRVVHEKERAKLKSL